MLDKNLSNMEKNRCAWSKHSLEIAYHDSEWGVPVHDDRKHFEFIVLDTFQAGLSWLTVLKKRNNFRKAFDDFDYRTISEYGSGKIDELLGNPGIIRNKMKINATIKNAQTFMVIQVEFGSFDKYIWSFVNAETIVNARESMDSIPATSAESDGMSKDLKKRGFSFVGSTTCYAYMQAAGLVNDHETSCFRYKEVIDL